MITRKGTNQYKTKRRMTVLESVLVVCLFATGVTAWGIHDRNTFIKNAISPLADSVVYAAEPTPTPKPTVDQMVDTYSKLYTSSRWEANRTKALLHFLLLREQNYGGSNNCGDSGKACGPLQFHEPTYQGYRKIMIKRGLVDYVGSRLDMHDAIQTAAWAIADGRENAWGPVLRGEIKL